MGTLKTRAVSERRRNARKPQKFTLKFRCVGGKVKPDSADRMGQIVNISRGGVLLHSKRPMPLGSVLKLQFPPNIFSGGAATLHGVVRRLDPETAAGDHPIGLMFVKIAARPDAPSPAKRPAAPQSNKKERRRAPRKAQNVVVKIRSGSFGAPVGKGDPEGLITNVSRGGMELSTDHPYPPGATLEVQIPATALGSAKRATGRVVWMMEGDRFDTYRLGIQMGKA